MYYKVIKNGRVIDTQISKIVVAYENESETKKYLF